MSHNKNEKPQWNEEATEDIMSQNMKRSQWNIEASEDIMSHTWSDNTMTQERLWGHYVTEQKEVSKFWGFYVTDHEAITQWNTGY